MENLSPKERAQVTVVLMRLILDLANGDAELTDPDLASALQQVMYLCYKSKTEALRELGRVFFAEALELVEQKDWLFTVMKLDSHFHLELKFGTDIKTARLAKSIAWVREPTVN
jgi:hypothetical protein